MQSAKTEPAPQDTEGDEDNTAAPSIEERKTEEIVIAFVGPVASGVSHTAKIFGNVLEDHYGYSCHPIKMSQLIKDFAPRNNMDISNYKSEDERIKELQECGTKMREDFGGDVLAKRAIEQIAVDRLKNEGYSDSDGSTPRRAERRRRVHIIDALKHPEEVSILRDVYGDAFWLIGVFAPSGVRERRLKDKGANQSNVQKLMQIDEHESKPSGQRVRNTIQKSDFFIRNDQDNAKTLNSTVKRFLEILFGIQVHTPTRHEAAMYTAQASAASSACLSRQVGAAIYSSDGELIGKGSNDVPKFGGGLYSEDDQSEDNRCFLWRSGICHNDDRKSKLYDNIFEELKELLKNSIEKKDVVRALRNTDTRNLIEYSRSVHAEMEAIISVARNNKNGLVGSTLYTTTYPCHNCARHIVASGINTVIYIEPYPKSLALELHDDAITTDENEQGKKVLFLQYEGVAPKNILRLFGEPAERKIQGKAKVLDRKQASPVIHAPLDGFHSREQMIVDQLKRLA